MAVDGSLEGLFAGSDHEVLYRDEDFPPTDMTGWTVVLDIRETDVSTTVLLTSTGVVSGVYSAVRGANLQLVTFTLTAAQLSTTLFPGDPSQFRYSISRTNAGVKQPLRRGTVTVVRTTQS